MARMAWVNPKCWSIENFEKICAKWGLLLYIDHDYLGMNSLTIARMLIQTKQQARIEECVNLKWGSGLCDLWVKEMDCCECLDMSEIINKRSHECDDYELEDCEDGAMYDGDLRIEHEKEDDTGSLKNVDDLVIKQNENAPKQNLVDCEGRWKNGLEENSSTPYEAVKPGSVLEQENKVYFDEQAILMVDRPDPGFEWGKKFDPICLEESFSFPEGCQEKDNNTPYSINPVIISCPQDPVPMLSHIELPPTRFDPMVQLNGESKVPITPSVNNFCIRESIAGYASTSKRPRGRPKRNSSTPAVYETPPSSLNFSEVNKTWEIAKVIGISSNDEEAVLRELRKSKRISTQVETSR